jgi:hypothetical protein
MINADQIVHEFGALARPVMREFMTKASCIASARTTVEVMSLFGLKAVPVPVSFIFHVPARKYMRVCGFNREEKKRMRAAAADWRPSSERGWNAHLIVFVENRWLVDPSIDQAGCEELGVIVPEEVLVIDSIGHNVDLRVNFEMSLGLKLDNGDEAKLVYRRIGKYDYRKTLAWNDEGLPFLAKRIANEMRTRLQAKELQNAVSH